MKVEVEVPENFYGLMKGLSSFVGTVKKEMDDNGGWDTADDLPAVISAAVTDLLPTLSGVAQIGEELKNDRASFIKGGIIGLTEMVEIFVQQNEETKAKEPKPGI